MDRKQEDMQCLGLFGIYKEAYKMIFSWKKVFTQITLTLILPLAFIIRPVVAPEYNKLSDLLTFEWITFCLLKAASFTFSLILYLPSTSVVVYTIACIYTGSEVTLKKVVSVVPKVWKRLMLTFVSNFISLFAYNIVALSALLLLMLIFILLVVFLASSSYLIAISSVPGVILYMVGLAYVDIVWQLAEVVTVLEDTCGFHAMRKSRALIKGTTGVAIITSVMFRIFKWLVRVAFEKLVVGGESLGMVNRVACGIICLLLASNLNLFELAIQTVIYLVCKSYHRENIDKSTLSDHLESVNLGHYVPMKAKDYVDHLEQFYV